MAEASDQTTSVCSHCDRIIPFSNIDLHYAHCSWNLVKCKICGDMVPGKLIEEHFLGTHATVSCSLCNETVERENFSEHKGQYCLQRIVKCDYCDFPLPAVDLFQHQEVCGSRTELCYLCRRFVILRELVNHESRCNGVPNIPAESSRDAQGPESAHGPRRRWPSEFSPKGLICSIAVTGVAVLLGSVFIGRKRL